MITAGIVYKRPNSKLGEGPRDMSMATGPLAVSEVYNSPREAYAGEVLSTADSKATGVCQDEALMREED